MPRATLRVLPVLLITVVVGAFLVTNVLAATLRGVVYVQKPGQPAQPLPGEQITLTLTDAGGTSHTYFGQTGSIDGSYTFSQLPTGTGEILLGNSYNCFGNFNSPFTVTVSSGTNTRNFTGIPNSRTATGTVTFPDNNPVAVNVRAHRDTPTGVVDDYAGLEPDRTTFHLQLYCDWSGYAEPYLVNPPNDAFIFEPANKHVDVLDNVNIGEFVAITNVSITEPLAGVNWNSGSSQTIRWTSCTNCDVSSQDVLLSPDGSTWQTLASGLAPSIRTLDWTVDGVPSSQCRVKIVAHRASGATQRHERNLLHLEPFGGRILPLRGLEDRPASHRDLDLCRGLGRKFRPTRRQGRGRSVDDARHSPPGRDSIA
jgi:hypothetical protein